MKEIKETYFYACCPYCNTTLIQAKNGMDSYIKCPKCDNYIYNAQLIPIKELIR